MTVALIINGVTYNYPETGNDDWGEDATAWAEAVTNQLLTLSTVGDIPLTNFPIEDQQIELAPVGKLVFDTDAVRGAFVDYNITRKDDDGGPLSSPQSFSETGTLILTYNSNESAASGTILSNSAENPTKINAVAHGLVTGDRVIISGSDSGVSINGHHEVTKIDDDNFTIEINNEPPTGSAGSAGIFEKTRWEVARFASGAGGPSGGVEIVIKDNGQGLYSSDSLGGSGYNGVLRFRARVIS